LNYLLDTCLISELVKPAPNPGVLDWLDAQPEERIFLSVVTLGEIQAGISKLVDSRRKLALMSWLENELLPRFAHRLLPVSPDVALLWGKKRGDAAVSGATLPLADSLIAATAMSHGMTVVTRNTSDLQRCGALTLNPWD
jgi:predicted nucleic acid-binding protein